MFQRQRVRDSHGSGTKPSAEPHGFAVSRSADLMNELDEITGRTWADVVRASALTRRAVGIVDRLARPYLSSQSHPELMMTLVDISHSAHRTLLLLDEAKQLFAEPLPGLDDPDNVTDRETHSDPTDERSAGKCPNLRSQSPSTHYQQGVTTRLKEALHGLPTSRT